MSKSQLVIASKGFSSCTHIGGKGASDLAPSVQPLHPLVQQLHLKGIGQLSPMVFGRQRA